MAASASSLIIASPEHQQFAEISKNSELKLYNSLTRRKVRAVLAELVLCMVTVLYPGNLCPPDPTHCHVVQLWPHSL